MVCYNMVWYDVIIYMVSFDKVLFENIKISIILTVVTSILLCTSPCEVHTPHIHLVTPLLTHGIHCYVKGPAGFISRNSIIIYCFYSKSNNLLLL